MPRWISSTLRRVGCVTSKTTPATPTIGRSSAEADAAADEAMAAAGMWQRWGSGWRERVRTVKCRNYEVENEKVKCVIVPLLLLR